LLGLLIRALLGLFVGALLRLLICALLGLAVRALLGLLIRTLLPGLLGGLPAVVDGLPKNVLEETTAAALAFLRLRLHLAVVLRQGLSGACAAPAIIVHHLALVLWCRAYGWPVIRGLVHVAVARLVIHAPGLVVGVVGAHGLRGGRS
jgi:hypothetical protein